LDDRKVLERLATLNGIDIHEVIDRATFDGEGRITKPNLSDIEVSDISPLSGLTGLTELALTGTPGQPPFARGPLEP
jgi:hypothetical protein